MAPPIASLPYNEETGPRITSIFLKDRMSNSNKALWLKSPVVRIGKPSSK